MDLSSSRGAAEALVVVVPQPDGRGLVTVPGSGVGCGGPFWLPEATAATDALRERLAVGGVARWVGLVSSVRAPEGLLVRICGEALPGAEPLSDAEARCGRIVQRLTAVLRGEPCPHCSCGGTCPWAFEGEADPDAGPCATCGCLWCGPMTPEFCAERGATDVEGLPACASGSPADRLRAALAPFDGDYLTVTAADVCELHAAATAMLAAPRQPHARLLAVARAFAEWDAVVFAVDAAEEEQCLGPVERAARALDDADASAIAALVRDGMGLDQAIAKFRADIGASPTEDEEQAVGLLDDLTGVAPGKSALLAHADALEATAKTMPLGEVEHGGPLDDAPTYNVIQYAARRARTAAGSL